MKYNNVILMGDSYKYSHAPQYPKGTTFISSYAEARGSKDPEATKTLVFGLQIFIKEYLLEPITMKDVMRAQEILNLHGEPFNFEGWKYIVDEYAGLLPITIETVREGTVVELSNVIFQVSNNDPKLYWLTSFVETALLRAIWYPTTVATNSWRIKQMFLEYAKKSGSNMDVSFKLHDFGARGVEVSEAAQVGGMAHLINFMGTDTVEALLPARMIYNIDMAGFSIPASEHSTMTLLGESGEEETIKNMLDQYLEKDKMLAMVLDSYNIYHTTENLIGGVFRERIIKSGGTVVVRPDSGDPLTVPIQIIEILMKKFGFSINDKGYRTLPSCIRVLQGDGITIESIPLILENLDKAKISLDNIAFGMGGGLLQMVNRDTYKFAMKASFAVINNEGVDVYKDPVGDRGKRSKKGVLGLYKDANSGEFYTKRRPKGWTNEFKENHLITVFENGKLLIDQTFDEIRELSNK